jgi:polyisoprenoid-binding protein YceI
MKKFIILTSCFLAFNLNAQLYKNKAEQGIISFFSKTPLEDIDAISKKATIVIKTTTNDIQVGVPMISFKFKKPLMEEHFNENYVETDKYPTCTFKGKINEVIDYSKEGEYAVTVKGIMDLHGVQKEIEAPGTITVKGKEISVTSTFKVKVADYNIKVPSLYVKNIAEIVDIKVQSVLEPYSKP